MALSCRFLCALKHVQIWLVTRIVFFQLTLSIAAIEQARQLQYQKDLEHVVSSLWFDTAWGAMYREGFGSQKELGADV